MADKKEETVSSYYSKGNEAFVSENYVLAVELYTAALQLESGYADCLVARAHAFIKSDKFDLAKEDADKAIEILRRTDSTSPALAKAFLRSGVASFNLGKYSEAKNCFTEGQKLGEESGLKQWMTWCDEKIAKFGGGKKEENNNKKEAKKEDKKEEKAVGEAVEEAVEKAVEKAVEEKAKPCVSEPTYDPQAMPVPKVSHDWYQTETQVVVEVRIKKLKPEECKIEIGETNLSVTASLPTGSEYSLELDLAHPVVPAQSGYKVLSTKVEVKLRKAEGVRWATLEGDGTAPLPGGVPKPAAASSGVKAPYASGRDWNAIEKSMAEDAEEKKEGEAALNEMFQKIYADASDDVKRAMNKSFQESGGTVLSTNWADIGKTTTEVKPPDGMEWKKYD